MSALVLAVNANPNNEAIKVDGNESFRPGGDVDVRCQSWRKRVTKNFWTLGISL